MSIRPVNAALAEKARVELNEDPERTQEDIQHLKDWIAKQPHLRARTDDKWLLVFLRGCKFSLEKAKQKLDLYYTMRNAVPEFFKFKHTDPKFLEYLSLGTILFLPNTWGSDTPVVSIFRMGQYDPNKYSVSDFMSAAHILEKIVVMDNDNATIAGFQTVMDTQGTSIQHFLQMTPLQMKKMTVLVQDAGPFRFKGFHYINTPPAFETAFNTFKIFLNEKNKTRLYVHNKNYEKMYQHIPKEILPVEYGGNGGTIPEILDYWRKKIDEYSSWLEEDEKYGVDESKRPGKPKTGEDLFGIDGSFRQLQFD